MKRRVTFGITIDKDGRSLVDTYYGWEARGITIASHEAAKALGWTCAVIRTWSRTFALFPVRREEGGLVWGRMIWTREVDRSQASCEITSRQYTDDPTKDYY